MTMGDREQNDRLSRINRREFLKTLAASGGAAACGSFLGGCGSAATASRGGDDSPGITVDLTRPENQSLAAVGGTLTLEANALDPKGMLLYRADENTILAFSRNCTHAGCTLGGFQDGISSCPCHASQFDTGGEVVKGPAAKPLKAYPAALSGSTVTITP
jgi:cytochrome b6-f complex iron-sulfur subunit